MHPTDAVLVEKCVNGQKDAFAEIVERYQHRVYFMSLTRMRDRHEAEDLAQETFIQAYRKLASYNPQRSFRNWLFTICANLGKNRLRSRARRREMHNPNPEINLSCPTTRSIAESTSWLRFINCRKNFVFRCF